MIFPCASRVIEAFTKVAGKMGASLDADERRTLAVAGCARQMAAGFITSIQIGP